MCLYLEVVDLSSSYTNMSGKILAILFDPPLASSLTSQEMKEFLVFIKLMK